MGFLAARVGPDGTCRSIHEIAPGTPRPTASQFKLFVLGALADQIAAGRVSWDQQVTVSDALKSVGNGEGSLQVAKGGTRVSVEEAATKMISISDNTATDLLVRLIGREDIEAKFGQWTEHASANQPFLLTREMFLLHYVPGLAEQYLATPQGQRAAFLAASVDPLPMWAIGGGLTTEPSHIDDIEWFASPADVCRAFAGLHAQSERKALAPLPSVLSQEVGGIGLDRSRWPTIWFKGGSEPGVLTLGWLATDGDGRTFVVEAMVSNPDAALSEASIDQLVAIGRDSFDLLQ